ncbi:MULTISPECIES: threonine synthase [unclassified Chryseobacterium]|uniref:threonine synthase n=1 Tax=unclassified Chryseobacterium TaxID=2593645 RepID=UPI00100AE397|nr:MULTISPECIES: threonine synthase [unclassified Chryseobacterium]RXM52673.1 threonine synthase [Chryseobacterium sp. CH25]RXM66729.1 threonine synthase [Chryseobacterium sp. CH1]
MKYYNLKDREEKIDFRTATIKGQGKNKGLFFPESIPPFKEDFIQNLNQYSDEEIAYQCMKDFIGNEIPSEILRKIVSETISFDIPLKKINDDISVLELFHGPTLAFKDIGAGFMSRCLSYFLENQQKKVTVLVATSGDTGGAVAHGFYDLPGIDVVILYPKNRVSPVQEKQLTALGKNIYALEVNGSFDDCQNLVKQAFSNEEINNQLFLTSANSINIARWLPQQIYYLLALKQWQQTENKAPVICVPSGNFGNICAGVLAHIRGLPTEHFIAACNANDVIPTYLETQDFNPKKAVATLSNAMDVGDPSNFVRILELFNNEFNPLKHKISGYSIDDSKTIQTISEVYKKEHYILEPHSAVAFSALEQYLKENPGKKGFILGTAHPVKFPEAVENAINTKIEIPLSLDTLMKKEKKTVEINPDFEELKRFLLDKN